ncbi:MAG: protease-like activity factor CPAF [Myxococcota bacterium]
MTTSFTPIKGGGQVPATTPVASEESSAPSTAPTMNRPGAPAISGAPLSSGGAARAEQAAPVQSQAELKAEMKSHIGQLARVFRDHYAPADWKAKSRNWDVEREHQRAIKAIDDAENITPKDLHKIIVKFAQAAGDYHVGARFYSTESAKLPFSVMSVGDRFFVVDVDKTFNPDFPIKPGDEIITFNGRPIGEEIAELRKELGNNVGATDQALASLRLTSRAGRVGMDVPKGEIEIGVKGSDGAAIQTHRVNWDYEPERLNKSGSAFGTASFSAARAPTRVPESEWARFGSMHTHHLEHPGHLEGSLNRFAIGAKQSFIPKLGEVTWETGASNPFHAYIFKMPDGKRVGYVRIPHYNAGAGEVLQFTAIMARMKRTDGLIIDQVNNPGGSVGYLYSLAAMLTDRLLYTPRHRMNITQREVENAYRTLDTTDSDFAAQQIPEQLRDTLRDNARFIVDQWRQGKTRTDPYHLGLGDYIAPSPLIQYDKPIMVLTNELDFSGGDFFPAILQDNKRAKIFGARTAGAGGYVGLIDQSPNDLGLQAVSYTGSLAERIDDEFIESDGITPDVKYELTVDDVRGGFKDYRNAILGEFGKMLEADDSGRKSGGLLGRIMGRAQQ